jgi:hypothetical protein
MAPVSIVDGKIAKPVAVVLGKKGVDSVAAAHDLFMRAGLDQKTIDMLLAGSAGNGSVKVDITDLPKRDRGRLLQLCRKDEGAEVIEYPPITPITARFFGNAFIRAKDSLEITGLREQLLRTSDEAPHNGAKRVQMRDLALQCEEYASGPRDEFIVRAGEIEAARTSRDEAVPGIRVQYDERIGERSRIVDEKISTCQSKKKNLTIGAIFATVSSVIGVTIDPEAAFKFFEHLLDKLTPLGETALFARGIVATLAGGLLATLWALRHRLDKRISNLRIAKEMELSDLRVQKEREVMKFLNEKSGEIKQMRQELDKFVANKVMEIQLAAVAILMDSYKEYVRHQLFVNGMENAYELDFKNPKDRELVFEFYGKVMGNGSVPIRQAASDEGGETKAVTA